MKDKLTPPTTPAGPPPPQPQRPRNKLSDVFKMPSSRGPAARETPPPPRETPTLPRETPTLPRETPTPPRETPTLPRETPPSTSSTNAAENIEPQPCSSRRVENARDFVKGSHIQQQIWETKNKIELFEGYLETNTVIKNYFVIYLVGN